MVPGSALQFRVKGPSPTPGRTLTLPGDRVVVGRSRAADLRLPHPEVSGAHARFLCKNGDLFIEDLGSVNGTRLDDRPLTPGRLTPLAPGTAVEIGGYTLRVSMSHEPSDLVGAEGTATLATLLVREMLARDGGGEALARLTVTDPTGQTRLVLLRPGRIVVGRSPDAQERIDDPDLSREHVAFHVQPAVVTVRDLDSKNGVFVNDQPVEHEAELRDGDRLRFGGCEAEFDDPAQRLLQELDAAKDAVPRLAEADPIVRDPADPSAARSAVVARPTPRRVSGDLARGLLILTGLGVMGLALWGLWRLFG